MIAVGQATWIALNVLSAVVLILEYIVPGITWVRLSENEFADTVEKRL